MTTQDEPAREGVVTVRGLASGSRRPWKRARTGYCRRAYRLWRNRYRADAV